MIGYLSGTVTARTDATCILDVGGVGYRMACSAMTLARLPSEGGPCKLWTHLQVRDDALVLFGFATESEHRMFEGLISVSGVGPKAALQMCSALTPESFKRALVTGDSDSLAAAPGIGKKTAQRIILELKEKLSLPDLEIVGADQSASLDARSALENLGYSPGEVRAALGEIGSVEDRPVGDVIRSALRVLTR